MTRPAVRNLFDFELSRQRFVAVYEQTTRWAEASSEPLDIHLKAFFSSPLQAASLSFNRPALSDFRVAGHR